MIAETQVRIREAHSASPSQATIMKLKPDEQGWPVVRFEPAAPELDLASDFLRYDIDIVLPSCDLLVESIRSVVAGAKTRWRWNGNSFIIEVEKPLSRL